VKILVTGSSGRIGGAIAARLKLNHQVIGLDLRPGPLTTEVADVEDTARLAALLAGTNAIVHTASLHVPDLAARSREAFRAVNVDATRRLLEAAGSAGVGRFIYTSTTSLYGDAMLPSDGAAVWVDEALTPQPRDIYDETKLAAEEACRDARLHQPADVTLLSRGAAARRDLPPLPRRGRRGRGAGARGRARGGPRRVRGVQRFGAVAVPAGRLPAIVRGRGIRTA
jgi:UDP-glucose 4-epimerase